MQGLNQVGTDSLGEKSFVIPTNGRNLLFP
jgi:hypothetical protein